MVHQTKVFNEYTIYQGNHKVTKRINKLLPQHRDSYQIEINWTFEIPEKNTII